MAQLDSDGIVNLVGAVFQRAHLDLKSADTKIRDDAAAFLGDTGPVVMWAGLAVSATGAVQPGDDSRVRAHTSLLGSEARGQGNKDLVAVDTMVVALSTPRSGGGKRSYNRTWYAQGA